MAKTAGDKKAVASLRAKMEGPELPDGLWLFANAYIDLDTERKWDRPIPWSKIIKWCEHYELSRTQTGDMLYYIRAIDNEVLKQRHAKAKREQQSPTTS